MPTVTIMLAFTRPGYHLKFVDTGTNTISEFHEKIERQVVHNKRFPLSLDHLIYQITSFALMQS